MVPIDVAPFVTVNVATRFGLVLRGVRMLGRLLDLIAPRSRGSTNVSETGVSEAVTVTCWSAAVW